MMVNKVENSQETFESRVRNAPPNEVVTVTCADYRELARSSYLFTSVGAEINPGVIEGIDFILNRGGNFLELRGHTDCARSKSEVPREPAELEENYLFRVNQHTLRKLWSQAEILLKHSGIAERLLRGSLEFCVSLLDVETGKIAYYETESRELVERVTAATLREFAMPSAERPRIQQLVGA